MIARCAKCQNTFSTDRFGAQVCPHCGAEVFLRDPNAPEPPPVASAPTASAAVPNAVPTTALPPGSIPSPTVDSADQAAPWEARGSHGLFGSFIETLRQSMFEPTRFFSRLRREPAGGAYSFGLIIWVFSTFVGSLWQAAQSSVLKPDQLSRMFPESAELWKKAAEFDSPQLTIVSILSSPAQAVVLFFIVAGILHLTVLLFCSGGKGWSSTIRAVSYASGPLLLSIIPFCGGLIGWVWSLILTIIAVSHLHKTTGGRAAAAVLVPILVLLCCSCLAAAVLVASVGALVNR